MKYLFLIWLVFASSTTAANSRSKTCPKFSSDYVISRALTIEEVEKYELVMMSEIKKIRPDIPEVPFGFENVEWIAFKSIIRPGDKLVHYSTDSLSWQHLAGDMGYAIIRSGCVVAKQQTLQN